jgi:S1-C subfamily serine protease
LALAGSGPAPWLNGGEQPEAAPAANKTIAQLVSEVTPGVGRFELLREYTYKNAQNGKDQAAFNYLTGTCFVIRCVRVGGNDTTDNIEFDVVTNYHVLEMPSAAPSQGTWAGPLRFFVLIYGVTTNTATILGSDQEADLAVIRVQGQAPKDRWPRPLVWADPNSIHVGDRAVAIGYARDLDGRPTVTRGIVSAMHRNQPTSGNTMGQFADLLQTDAAVNNGNWGGPLLNMRGEVMGVNTYSYPPVVTIETSGNVTVDTTIGINFARSSATARPFAEQIVKQGRVNRPALGCNAASMSESNQRFYNWPLGARIMSVAQNSLAAQIGLKVNDIVVAVGSAAQRPDNPDPSQEAKVATLGDLNDQLGLRAADASLWVRFIRPAAVWQTANAAGQFPEWSGGEAFITYLR